MDLSLIRNFCIIAHIDHGKSTLADRLLELTGALGREEVRAQTLDSMELERERGITIKAKAVRLNYKARDGRNYRLNLVDTPGHVDFSYEVSRTLAACDGAILVIDATQGIQAQTLANAYIAMEHNLEIIFVLNKIDLPASEPEHVLKEVETSFGCNANEILLISAKTGQGVPGMIEEIVRRTPSPRGDAGLPLRALIFDSRYDVYKGVIAYLRVFDGRICKGDKLRLIGQDTELDVLEVGYFAPSPVATTELAAGDIGYIATGLKSVVECRVGDTITSVYHGADEPLIGYRHPKPMVYAGIYPTQAEDFLELREAIERLRLNDASLSYETESSPVLGNGFRCGFLGPLHLDIVRERLEREFSLSLVVTVPGVSYIIIKTNGQKITITNPADFPSPNYIERIEEPWVRISVITPSVFMGTLIELFTDSEGIFKHTEYMGQYQAGGDLGQRVRLEYEMPLRSILTTFYDQLKSRSRGYASLDYELIEYREAKLVRLDVLINAVTVDAFSRIVPPDKTYEVGKAMVSRLKEVIPRQLFRVPIQAAVGNQVVARYGHIC
jgi:GTP-binding protein LepA